MVEQTVVALFDDAAAARRALESLQEAGIARDRFQISGDTTGVSTSGTTASGTTGMDRSHPLADFSSRFAEPGGRVTALTQLGVPEDDAHLYAEGVRRGGTLLVGEVGDDDAERALDVIEGHSPVDVVERGQHYRSSGWSRYDAGTDYSAEQAVEERSRYGTGIRGAAGEFREANQVPVTAATPRTEVAREQVGATGRDETIPIVEEQIDIQKRAVERGRVRIHSRIVERPVEEQVSLRTEHVSVERRPVDRKVGSIPEDAFRDRTVEVTETAEEAVVQKDARIREELVVRKDVEERAETIRDTVRHTEVDVEDNRNRAADLRTEGVHTDVRETGTGTGTGLGAGAGKPGIGERTREAGHDAAADMKENRGVGGKIADAARDVKEDLKGNTGTRGKDI
jgi:stress response protein YsnF